MPMLSGSDADEVDAGRQPSDDVPGGLEVQLCILCGYSKLLVIVYFTCMLTLVFGLQVL